MRHPASSAIAAIHTAQADATRTRSQQCAQVRCWGRKTGRGMDRNSTLTDVVQERRAGAGDGHGDHHGPHDLLPLQVPPQALEHLSSTTRAHREAEPEGKEATQRTDRAHDNARHMAAAATRDTRQDAAGETQAGSEATNQRRTNLPRPHARDEDARPRARQHAHLVLNALVKRTVAAVAHQHNGIRSTRATATPQLSRRQSLGTDWVCTMRRRRCSVCHQMMASGRQHSDRMICRTGTPQEPAKSRQPCRSDEAASGMRTNHGALCVQTHERVLARSERLPATPTTPSSDARRTTTQTHGDRT